jgi:hypothetical protein
MAGLAPVSAADVLSRGSISKCLDLVGAFMWFFIGIWSFYSAPKTRACLGSYCETPGLQIWSSLEFLELANIPELALFGNERHGFEGELETCRSLFHS